MTPDYSLDSPVIAVVSSEGAVVESSAYDPYGARILTSQVPKPSTPQVCTNGLGAPCASRVGDPLGFQGARLYGATGLCAMRARHLYLPHPSVLRTTEIGPGAIVRSFLTPDPLGPVDAFDLWLYVGGDPFNFWDPFGLNGADDPLGNAIGAQFGPRGPLRFFRGIFNHPAYSAANQGTNALLTGVGDLVDDPLLLPLGLYQAATHPLQTVEAIASHYGGLIAACDGFGSAACWELAAEIGLAIAGTSTAKTAITALPPRPPHWRPWMNAVPDRPPGSHGAGAAPSPSSSALGLGSTVNPAHGTFHPRNLVEQLAVEASMSAPTAPNAIVLPMTMVDPRWPASAGWVKMAQHFDPGGPPVEVHYVYNTVTHSVDDFKIVDRLRQT